MFEVEATDPETGRKFMTNPVRDIAYFLPQLLPDLKTRLDATYLPVEDKKRLEEWGLSAEDLLPTYAKLCLFFEHALNSKIKTPIAAMTTAGFFEEPTVCQDIVLAAFAKQCVGACWAGMRSSIREFDCPPIVSTLREMANDILDYKK